MTRTSLECLDDVARYNGMRSGTRAISDTRAVHRITPSKPPRDSRVVKYFLGDCGRLVLVPEAARRSVPCRSSRRSSELGSLRDVGRWAWGYFGGVGVLVGGVELLVGGVEVLVGGVEPLGAGVGLLAGGLSPCLVSRFC